MAKVVFMGTPDFAVPVLRQLIAQHDVIGVVTQPDRPAGRNRQLQMSPIKQVALETGIPVQQPEKIRRAEAIAELRQWSPDVYIVAAFGQLLPQTVLDIPPHGSINVHASLLPRWRGAAPIQAVIRAGDAETGITIMKMDAGLDTGAMLSQRAIPLAPDETGQSLHDKLSLLGGDLLIETLPGYLSGAIQPQPTGRRAGDLRAAHRQGGRTHRLDGERAAQIERTMRAFTPWPGTLHVLGRKGVENPHGGTVGEGSAEPGRVVDRSGQIAVGTGAGLFYPSRVQLEGRGVVSITDFVRGYPAFVGALLGGA